ncbi:MAG: radical SAM protein [Asgard group archaeon]|nr:radical SAM protein [Asgard group archaeon]
MKIRASIGTAAALHLEKVIVDVAPTTAYLMLYNEDHCLANCSFCPQAQESSGRSDKLSRILWPKYNLSDIIDKLKNMDSGLKRICLQTVLFQEADDQIFAILKELKRNNIKQPISVCSYPMSKQMFSEMKKFGVTRVAISFDCATPELFEKIKGKEKGPKLSWELLKKSIQDACDVFGNRFVSTHLIVGLGETEREAISFIQHFIDKKITIGLFAFTPVKGTDLEILSQPSMDKYRRIQLGKYFIENMKTTANQMKFKKENQTILDYGVNIPIILDTIKTGKPFRTSGCSHCNRPFYNESPGKPLYNYPRELTDIEINDILTYFKQFLKNNQIDQ